MNEGVTPELQLLAVALVLAIVQLYWAWAAVRGQRKREKKAGLPPGPLKGNVSNVHRAFRNLMETLPIFTAAVIATQMMGLRNDVSFWGAHVWVWARVLYAPVYGYGLIWLRPWVWYLSMFGLFALVGNLFAGWFPEWFEQAKAFVLALPGVSSLLP